MGLNEGHTHRHAGSQRTSEASRLEAVRVEVSLSSTVTLNCTVLLAATLEPLLVTVNLLSFLYPT